MNEWTQDVLKRPKILLDTNLLILYLIGLQDRSLIERFKVTRSEYTFADFELVEKIVTGKELVVSSSLLTETSNLGGKLSGEALRTFRVITRKIGKNSKDYGLPPIEILEGESFLEVGFADSEIALISKKFSSEIVVLTSDLRLAVLLQKHGTGCINFNHLRTFD